MKQILMSLAILSMSNAAYAENLCMESVRSSALAISKLNTEPNLKINKVEEAINVGDTLIMYQVYMSNDDIINVQIIAEPECFIEKIEYE